MKNKLNQLALKPWGVSGRYRIFPGETKLPTTPPTNHMKACIIYRTITFASSYRYIFPRVSLRRYYQLVTKPDRIGRSYFSTAIYSRWTNKLSLVVLDDDVAKVHSKEQRSDFAKFLPPFLPASYIASVRSGETGNALAKRNDRSLFLALFTGGLRALVRFSSERSRKMPPGTISFPTPRLAHSFLRDRGHPVWRIINVTSWRTLDLRR